MLVISLGVYFNDNHRYETSVSPLTAGINVIIDPGHGIPDGGAVGISGSVEHEINLKISQKIGDLLQQSGANVIYTREDENSIADKSETKIRDIKKSDMRNRKKIKDNSDADLFISIHMNKFDSPQYCGAQVFYDSESEDSKRLAESIQKYLHDYADKENTRTAQKCENSIYLLKNSKYPSVVVECGFISNPIEEKRLQEESYQDKIAFSVYCGIINYLHS